jgi:hypothetical protein
LKDKLLQRPIPELELTEGTKTERQLSWKWAKKFSFAEDFYLTCQAEGIRVTEAPYEKRSGMWTCGLGDVEE